MFYIYSVIFLKNIEWENQGKSMQHWFFIQEMIKILIAGEQM